MRGCRRLPSVRRVLVRVVAGGATIVKMVQNLAYLGSLARALHTTWPQGHADAVRPFTHLA